MVLKAGTLSPTFGSNTEIFETTYDFSADTGAVATYVMTAGAGAACMVKLLGVKTEVAPLSAGAATISVGTSASGTAFLTTEGKASFALGALVPPDVTTFVKLAADATLDIAVGTAVLTAGKLICVWEVLKF